jgi:molybdenum cofactor guanylyltransferase
LLGIILCGGRSTRMGTDKGLLKLDGKPWAQIAMDKMSALDLQVKVSVNNNQYPAYSAIFSPNQLVSDNQSLIVNGPLSGVLSTHLQHPTEDLFILACDMLMMEPALLSELRARHVSGSFYDAYIFINNNEPEPLCGIYTAKGLAIILNLLLEGRLIRHSMKFTLEQLRVNAIPVSEDQKRYFRNFNSAAELDSL